VGIITADEPVEPSAKGLALKPEFLSEGLELVKRTAAAVAIEYVEVVEVGILATRRNRWRWWRYR
jgi:hypothetical protein